MASATEKERARRAVIEKAYVQAADTVPWREAEVAERPTKTITQIIAAAEGLGWQTWEMYRETFRAPRWVAVRPKVYEFVARPVAVYSLHVANLDGDLEEGSLQAVEIHFLDGIRAGAIKVGYMGSPTWSHATVITSIAKMIRESAR